ncbi:DNA polymerase I [Ehrlichia ruminantium]|uniref:DNA polymerase I n=1 Tax=Ehrlichia ruminantium TaxID=779 RepID=A0AAE6UI82_EHRRU|nr:DNA polymerase I [Ehrlichia ruminantium]QGR02137.1 DNA polymerase I [Ehrlichia ruminantium]QGR03057.1 DNA polymerase I [Ehrlichia ruminantium]QGR03982.1 DNA polymerase I [Ehrlichia ruminantium]
MSTFTIIDAYGLLFRAYYALPHLTTSYGTPIGGVYGFINMLLKYIETHTTDYLVVVFDTGSKNFRHNIYSEYKSNRIKLPDDLISQFPLLREAVNALNIAYEEVVGYEADDVIATLSKNYSKFDYIKVTVVTSDKDLLQLLEHNIHIFDPVKNKYIVEEDVQDKFGISSSKLLDFLSLTGDASDNIPGVPGIGIKTAAKLLNQFGSLDNLLSQSHAIEKNKCRESIIQYHDQAILSRQLLTLCDTVNLDDNIEKYLSRVPDTQKLVKFLEKYELQSLVNKVGKIFKIDTSITHQKQDNNKEIIKIQAIPYSIETLEMFIENAKDEGIIALHINSIDNVIDSISLSYRESILLCINTEHITHALQLIKPLLSLDYILKVIYDVKTLLTIIQENTNITAFDDILIMSYSLDAGLHDHTLKNIISRNMQHDITDENITASTLLSLHTALKKNLLTNQLCTTYYRLEKPLINVLYNMEKIGIMVDCSILNKLSSIFSHKISTLEQKIYKLSGEEFNIASSKQLGTILFDKMGIKKGKKLSSGTYSTDAEVLHELALNGIEIADEILKWRHFTKLKNTYTDTLAKQIDHNTGRVHTFYSMTSTATGRLSSSNPNLQNIPIRSEEGNAIRSAFIAKKGYKLIAADYSQIELRIMAHIANVQAFKNAFSLDQDIHSITAQQIFNTQDIDNKLRRKAKSINFGIIYGISAFGLAKQLGITRLEAGKHIDNYFKSYPEIKSYIEDIKVYARTHGYTRTIFGRKCFIKDINSNNHTLRNFSERAAVNAPLQGTSADIIKMSMIHLFDILKSGSMILQVHDELLFEVPEDHVDDTIKLIKEAMEGITRLSVPLKVDTSIGDNWGNLVPYN